jgi:hypothetical protein
MGVDLTQKNFRRAIGNRTKAIITCLSVEEDFRETEIYKFRDYVLAVNAQHDVL